MFLAKDTDWAKALKYLLCLLYVRKSKDVRYRESMKRGNAAERMKSVRV